MPQHGLAGNIVERDFVPGHLPLGSTFRKFSGALFELSFYLQDFEDSLQTRLGSLNRTVRLGDGVYGSIERSEISRKDDQCADGERTGENVTGSHPNDNSCANRDDDTYRPCIKV